MYVVLIVVGISFLAPTPLNLFVLYNDLTRTDIIVL